MSLPAWSHDPDPLPAALPAMAPAEVLPLPKRRALSAARLAASLQAFAGVLLPPLVTLGVVLAIWQDLSGDGAGGLPGPATIWTDSKDLILHPFFDRGGVDKGLFWHALTSLKRVAIGFSFAA